MGKECPHLKTLEELGVKIDNHYLQQLIEKYYDVFRKFNIDPNNESIYCGLNINPIEGIIFVPCIALINYYAQKNGIPTEINITFENCPLRANFRAKNN